MEHMQDYIIHNLMKKNNKNEVSRFNMTFPHFFTIVVHQVKSNLQHRKQ